MIQSGQKKKFPISLDREEFLIFDPLVDIFFDKFRFNPGQPMYQLDDRLPGKTGVAVFEVVPQDMSCSTEEPFAGIFGNSQRKSDFVGFAEFGVTRDAGVRRGATPTRVFFGFRRSRNRVSFDACQRNEQ